MARMERSDPKRWERKVLGTRAQLSENEIARGRDHWAIKRTVMIGDQITREGTLPRAVGNKVYSYDGRAENRGRDIAPGSDHLRLESKWTVAGGRMYIFGSLHGQSHSPLAKTG